MVDRLVANVFLMYCPKSYLVVFELRPCNIFLQVKKKKHTKARLIVFDLMELSFFCLIILLIRLDLILSFVLFNFLNNEN